MLYKRGGLPTFDLVRKLVKLHKQLSVVFACAHLAVAFDGSSRQDLQLLLIGG